ncbi:MAG TPA: CBS domain-containing protein, partial [Longimicrobiales bacterium]|nr:CBS domain-containing protein [Longimicrobiales bacterium]
MRENRMLESEPVRVADLMARKDGGAPEHLIGVEPGTPVRQALSVLTTSGVSQVPVLQDGDCVGSLSEGGLMARVIAQPELLDRSVEAVMEPPFPVVDEGQEPRAIAPLLTRENPAVLVRRGGRIAGILTRYDMVRHLTR